MLTVQTGYASEIGRSRPVNQDSLLVSDAMFAVADGMGGHAAGEVASQMAVAGLRRLAARTAFNADDVRAELIAANDEIVASADHFPERQGMGTTIAGLAVTAIAGADHWVVFNVGDSRVYRFAGGALAQLTVDHTEVAELVAAGVVPAEDAQYHPRRHIVTRALGSDPPPEPDVWVFPPTAGERFLICSDGLFLELSEAEIIELLRAGTSAQSLADELVRRAKAYGGRDDATVIVVDHSPVASQASDDMEDTAPRSRPSGPAG